MGDHTHDDEEMILAGSNEDDDDGAGGDEGGGDEGEEDEGEEDEGEEDEGEEDEGEEDEGEEDEGEEDEEAETAAGGDGGGGDDDGGDDGDDGDDDEDDDDEDLELVEDEEIYASAEDFPNAEEEDFEDDDGDWSDDDYETTAEHLFGDHEFFGETAEEQWVAEGYELLDEAEEEQYVAPLAARAPAAAKSVKFVRSGSRVAAKGFVSIAMLQELRALFPGLDFGDLHVTVPEQPEKRSARPRKLPAKLGKVAARPGVDLRKFATPVGDQKQTMRCAAFAWTHAVEMVARMKGQDYPRLSCSYTMLQIQKLQGDYKDFAWAAAGGDGTVGGLGPGEVLIKAGTCRGDLWPDDDKAPRADEKAMAKDAARYKLGAKIMFVKLEDLKKVLSAGYPVYVSMNTGEGFSKVGRDGRFSAAEQPSGDHGRHAMLLVGYTGNYYVIKNSWGASWGDKGYCYIPKKVLAASEPRFVAIGVVKK